MEALGVLFARGLRGEYAVSTRIETLRLWEKVGGPRAPPELRVPGLSDAANYNRKATIVP
jgi:hypothetical protein